MYAGSLPHDRIIAAFQKHVPSCYVRDYSNSGGYLTVCLGYRDIRWADQLTSGRVYRQVPAITLVSIPRGNVPAKTKFMGLKLHTPGWRIQFKKAASMLSLWQKRKITTELGVGQVFPEVY